MVFAGTAVAAVLRLPPDDPLRWNALGFMAGLGLALPLERLRAGSSKNSTDPGDPVDRSGRPAVERPVLATGVGVAGLVPFHLGARWFGEEAVVAGAAMIFLATLWALLGVPALFGRAESHSP